MPGRRRAGTAVACAGSGKLWDVKANSFAPRCPARSSPARANGRRSIRGGQGRLIKRLREDADELARAAETGSTGLEPATSGTKVGTKVGDQVALSQLLQCFIRGISNLFRGIARRKISNQWNHVTVPQFCEPLDTPKS